MASKKTFKYVEVVQKRGQPLMLRELKGKDFCQTTTGALVGTIGKRLKMFNAGQWGMMEVAPQKPMNSAPRKKRAERRPSIDFMRALTPSAELATLVGKAALPKTEVVKKVWAYIKKNNLQDLKNRGMINLDEKLKGVFGNQKQVSMFDMPKYISKHLK